MNGVLLAAYDCVPEVLFLRRLQTDAPRALLDAARAVHQGSRVLIRPSVTHHWRFIRAVAQEFFDQNPISQLGFIITHDKVAEYVTNLSGERASGPPAGLAFCF